MSLVAYSDSEGSDDEQPQTKPEKPALKSAAASSNVNFTVNKANPRKIQVRLNEVATNGAEDGEPAAKRPRVGGGAFSGFNAMLPAPKRDAEIKATPRSTARKVFSLRTGAEPAFSRESDAELRHLFAEQDTDVTPHAKEDDTIPPIPKIASAATEATKEQPVKGNPFMFKPLSVARNNKKPKRKAEPSGPANSKTSVSAIAPLPASSDSAAAEHVSPSSPPKKVSLFSMNNEPELVARVEPESEPDEDEIVEFLDETVGEESYSASFGASGHTQPQSLDAIASDLHLSKADRRQLFGRRGQGTASAINVVNFNTDQEYAANEVLRASGEQAQHNPVRTIAPGKHSLKQLVTAATGQKEALEESFATGRRNRKEAGSKYGW